jgi:hypothetical protein
MKKGEKLFVLSDKILFFVAIGLRIFNFSRVYPSHILEVIEMLSWMYVVGITILIFGLSKKHRQRIIEYIDIIFPFL